MGGGGAQRGTEGRRQLSLRGPLKPTWCCHGVARNEWHMNKTSYPFQCACLVCPLSFLHQPIFTDITPLPQLPVTYITLTTGSFLWLAFTTDIYFTMSAVPFSGVISPENESSQTPNSPFIPASPVVYSDSCWCLHCHLSLFLFCVLPLLDSFSYFPLHLHIQYTFSIPHVPLSHLSLSILLCYSWVGLRAYLWCT